MLHWLKRLFHRPRLIERYEDLDAIIEAHNKLIQKTLAVMCNANVPPKYVLSRFKAIQDAEEKAVAAYWRNKARNQDKWYRRAKQSPATSENDANRDTVSDIAQENTQEMQEQQLSAPQTVDALPLDATDAQALAPSKESVVEIHIKQ